MEGERERETDTYVSFEFDSISHSFTSLSRRAYADVVDYDVLIQDTRCEEEKISDTIVVFTDGPDPDNFVFVLATIRRYNTTTSENIVHIVVTGRYVNKEPSALVPFDV